VEGRSDGRELGFWLTEGSELGNVVGIAEGLTDGLALGLWLDEGTRLGASEGGPATVKLEG